MHPTATNFVTIQEAARIAHVTPRTIHRRIGDGTITPYHLGRRVLIDLSELEAAIKGGAK